MVATAEHDTALDVPRPAAPASEPRVRAPGRADIQGLRALAVALVIVYHLRPEWVRGGFVGVDVFFVISGFLIIGSLTRELERARAISLLQFYGRRIRRLLPASTVVIVATGVGSLLLLPASQWQKVMSGATDLGVAGAQLEPGVRA